MVRPRAHPQMNTHAEELHVWNQAYERLRHFLETFGLGDKIQVATLTLRLLGQAREIHRADPSADPTTVTLQHAQTELNRWLATNLDEKDSSSSQLLASGYIALLLSRLSEHHPEAFLAAPLPEEMRKSLQQTLVITGPDLTVSSMTPRHLDYGPMLGLARQTWHRWDAKSFAMAILFWLGVYGIFYWWLSAYL
jgi:hypothetical protein